MDLFDVAITIDDVPWARSGQGPQPKEVLELTDRLLAHLTSRDLVAAGYVNCDWAAEGAPVLRKWLAAGMTLGNHQAAHDNIDKVKESVYLEGVRRCDSQLRAVTGGPVKTFRFPYLANGKGAEKRDRVHGVLTEELGYQIARVTAANHEWLLARYYAEAQAAGDEARANEIADYYVEHVRASVANARAVARDKLGRDVAHVLLLHANTLAADHMGRALDALSSDGAVFVPIEKALADPVYALPNAFEGRGGISWLYRVAPISRTPWDDATMTEIRARFGGK